ncbi:hypothetical protein [Sorangium sp. So ce1335]|uniref:hypothetical protein n=1 Tax=Sorangium sp. So ce1335 TaxID=3133335 RepID=UPI003F5EAC1D
MPLSPGIRPGDGPDGTPPAADYAAYPWPGPGDLLVVKADREADWCVKLHVLGPPATEPRFDVSVPEGWVLADVEITNRAADCDSPEAPRLGIRTRATGATGILWWSTDDSGLAACDVGVNVTITSFGEPATDDLRASGLHTSADCR